MIHVTVGGSADLSVTFVDLRTEEPVDPDNVALRVQRPDGTETDESALIEHDPGNTGVYEAALPIDAAGGWYYAFVATGAGAAVVDGFVYGQPSVLDPLPLPVMPPRAADVAGSSALDWAALGWSSGDVVRIVAETVQLVEELTGRTLDGTLPDRLRRIALRAVTLYAEHVAVGESTTARAKAIRNVRLRSITAGPWSETYFGPEDAAKAKMLHPDQAVHAALWALATEDKREEWLVLWGGKPRPAASITAFDFRRLPGGYGIDYERH